MNIMNRLATVTAAAALAASALLMPTAANAVPILAEDSTNTTCVVTGGELKWGVKEAFRSYISGSIANGDWVVADGTTYETPLFSWANPVGEINAETGEGTVSFAGSIHFSGHAGVLNLLLENPTIVFGGDGTAQLLLDTKSNNAQGELVVDEQQAYIGKIEGIGQTDPASGALAFADAPVVLTSDGATAFSGFYASGDALDPVSLSLQFGPCEGQAKTVEPVADHEGGEPEVKPIAAEAPASNIPWLPIIVGGVALIVIGVTIGMLLAGRKKGAGAADGDGAGAGAGAGVDDAADAAPDAHLRVRELKYESAKVAQIHGEFGLLL